MATAFQIKRIYDAPSPQDGSRVLVDRLWPRGVSKQRAALDEWLKDAAPSTQLREEFGHMAERFEDFRAKYRLQLATEPKNRQAVVHLLALGRKGPVTLLYAAKSPSLNHAAVLRDYLAEQEAAH